MLTAVTLVVPPLLMTLLCEVADGRMDKDAAGIAGGMLIAAAAAALRLSNVI